MFEPRSGRVDCRLPLLSPTECRTTYLQSMHPLKGYPTGRLFLRQVVRNSRSPQYHPPSGFTGSTWGVVGREERCGPGGVALSTLRESQTRRGTSEETESTLSSRKLLPTEDKPRSTRGWDVFDRSERPPPLRKPLESRSSSPSSRPTCATDQISFHSRSLDSVGALVREPVTRGHETGAWGIREVEP